MHDVAPRTFASQRLLRPFFALALAASVLAMLLAGASPARAQSYEPTGNPIADGALNHVGQHGGQCFTFMRMVVERYGGVQLGFGYRQAYLDGGGYEVTSEEAQAGDIIQLADDNRLGPGQSYTGLHTAIILENHGGGRFTVVDSNRNWNEMVQVHEYEPWGQWAAARYPYITVRIWRIPLGDDVPSTEPSEPAPETVYGPGDIARVETGGDNLRLRPAPGLANDPVALLPSGAEVTVVSGETIVSSGYTWIEVTSPHGQGWVATAFISLHARAEAAESSPTATATASPTATATPSPTPDADIEQPANPFENEEPVARIVIPGMARN